MAAGALQMLGEPTPAGPCFSCTDETEADEQMTTMAAHLRPFVSFDSQLQ